MIPGDFWHPTVTKVVLGRSVLAVVRFQQTDEVGGKIIPKAGRLGLMRQVIAQLLLAAVAARHRQIAGQDIVERWNVSRPLNRGVTAQRQNTTAGPTNVTEQELQDCGGPDDLNAFRMLRPAERVTNCRGFS